MSIPSDSLSQNIIRTITAFSQNAGEMQSKFKNLNSSDRKVLKKALETLIQLGELPSIEEGSVFQSADKNFFKKSLETWAQSGELPSLKNFADFQVKGFISDVNTLLPKLKQLSPKRTHSLGIIRFFKWIGNKLHLRISSTELRQLAEQLKNKHLNSDMPPLDLVPQIDKEVKPPFPLVDSTFKIQSEKLLHKICNTNIRSVKSSELRGDLMQFYQGGGNLSTLFQTMDIQLLEVCMGSCGGFLSGAKFKGGYFDPEEEQDLVNLRREVISALQKNHQLVDLVTKGLVQETAGIISSLTPEEAVFFLQDAIEKFPCDWIAQTRRSHPDADIDLMLRLEHPPLYVLFFGLGSAIWLQNDFTLDSSSEQLIEKNKPLSAVLQRLPVLKEQYPEIYEYAVRGLLHGSAERFRDVFSARENDLHAKRMQGQKFLDTVKGLIVQGFSDIASEKEWMKILQDRKQHLTDRWVKSDDIFYLQYNGESGQNSMNMENEALYISLGIESKIWTSDDLQLLCLTNSFHVRAAFHSADLGTKKIIFGHLNDLIKQPKGKITLGSQQKSRSTLAAYAVEKVQVLLASASNHDKAWMEQALPVDWARE